MQHLSWLNAILAAPHQTQTCKEVSPTLASLMSHEPTDAVNKPCEARRSLNLPLGHHGKRPRSCRLSRNRIIVPITARVPSFSQAPEVNLVVWVTPRRTWTEALIPTSIRVIAQPVYRTSLSSSKSFFAMTMTH